MTPPPAALVRPGMVHIYEWMVPVGAGPVEGEADCLTYLYYSAVDPVKDTSSGLVGPLLICRPKSLKKGVQVRGKTKKTPASQHIVWFRLQSKLHPPEFGIMKVDIFGIKRFTPGCAVDI